MGVVNTEEMTPEIIRQYLIPLSSIGHKAGCINAHYRSIKAFLNWYWDEFEPEGKNPIKKVHSPKVSIKPLPGVSIEHLQRMIQTSNHPRDKAILACLVDSGCRTSEFLSINIEDIDLLDGMVRNWKGKGNKFRIIYIGKGSRKLLQ